MQRGTEETKMKKEQGKNTLTNTDKQEKQTSNNSFKGRVQCFGNSPHYRNFHFPGLRGRQASRLRKYYVNYLTLVSRPGELDRTLIHGNEIDQYCLRTAQSVLILHL